MDGLGKVDSRLNIRTSESSSIATYVYCIKRHVAQFCSKFSYNLWTKIFKDKIFEEGKKPQNPRKFEPSKFSGYTVLAN